MSLQPRGIIQYSIMYVCDSGRISDNMRHHKPSYPYQHSHIVNPIHVCGQIGKFNYRSYCHCSSINPNQSIPLVATCQLPYDTIVEEEQLTIGQYSDIEEEFKLIGWRYIKATRSPC